jgi:hypothetical protein
MRTNITINGIKEIENYREQILQLMGSMSHQFYQIYWSVVRVVAVLTGVVASVHWSCMWTLWLI